MTDRVLFPEFVVSRWLTGSKRAFREGNRIYVSPAMWELLTHAEGEELMRLLRAIEYVELPESLPRYRSVPLSPHSI